MKKRSYALPARLLAAALCVVLTLSLFGGAAFAAEDQKNEYEIGLPIADDVMVGGDARNETLSDGVFLRSTGPDGGVGIQIDSYNDPVNVTVNGNVYVDDRSDTGYEAAGIQSTAHYDGSIRLQVNADVSVSTSSGSSESSAYGVKLINNNENLQNTYWIPGEDGSKIPVVFLEYMEDSSRAYASLFTAKRGVADVSEEFRGLYAFYADNGDVCDLYIVEEGGLIRYRSVGLPMAAPQAFYGYLAPSEYIPPEPYTVTITDETDETETTITLERMDSEVLPDDFDLGGYQVQKMVLIDPKGTMYLETEGSNVFQGNVIRIPDGAGFPYQSYEGIAQTDAVLHGKFSAESVDATALEIKNTAGTTKAELLPGTELDASGTIAAGLYFWAAESAEVKGEDVTVRSVSSAQGRSEAMGIWSLTSFTDAAYQSLISLTGSNHITACVDEGTPVKYAAGILNTASVAGTNTIHFEGDIDASGDGMVGIETLSMIPLKYDAPARAIVTMIGDVNLSDSNSDALYAETIPLIPAMASMTKNSAEIYLRGNITVTNGCNMAAGVSVNGGTVIVDGDIDVSGTDDLIGVYADRNSTVLVTGEINAPTAVYIPLDESILKRNNSRVYVWKGSETNRGKTGQVGYVIRIKDGLEAALSGGANFYTSPEYEGMTYYGAAAGNTVTVTTDRDDILILDAYGEPVAAEKTADGYTFTMPADCGVTVTHEHDMTFMPETSVDCETNGNIAYYVCNTCGRIFLDAEGKTETTLADVVIPATGHLFGEPTWDWDGLSAAAARFVCRRDPSHIRIRPAEITTQVIDGHLCYVATVVMDGKTYTDTVVGRISPASSPAPVNPVTPVTPATPAAPTEPESELPFTDVSPLDNLYETIKYVYGNDLMKGVSDTEFDLYSTLTRGMAATILYRMEGSPAVTYTGAFSDVPEGQWYTDGVEWAAAEGIVLGYDTGAYGVNDPVTREQLAAILYRFAERKGYDTDAAEEFFADAGLISDYAVEAVKWAVSHDILRTGDGSRVRPTENAKRWEIALAVHMFCLNLVK